MSRNKVPNNLDAVKDLFESLGLEDEHVVGIGVNMGSSQIQVLSPIYVKHKAYLESVGFAEVVRGKHAKMSKAGLEFVTVFD